MFHGYFDGISSNEHLRRKGFKRVINVHLLLRFKCQDDYLRVLLRESLYVQDTKAARVCIEIDRLKPRPERLWIGMGEFGGYWQDVVYLNLPDYCCSCSRLGHAKENCRSSGEEVQAVQRIPSAPIAPAPIVPVIPKVWVPVPHVVHRRLESVEGNVISGGVTVAPLDAPLSEKIGHFLGSDGSLLPSSVLCEDSGGPFCGILAEEAGGVPAVSSSMVRSTLHGNSLSKNGNLLALSKESEEARSSGIPRGIIAAEEGVSPARGSPSLACPAPAVAILGIPEESLLEGGRSLLPTEGSSTSPASTSALSNIERGVHATETPVMRENIVIQGKSYNPECNTNKVVSLPSSDTRQISTENFGTTPLPESANHDGSSLDPLKEVHTAIEEDCNCEAGGTQNGLLVENDAQEEANLSSMVVVAEPSSAVSTPMTFAQVVRQSPSTFVKSTLGVNSNPPSSGSSSDRRFSRPSHKGGVSEMESNEEDMERCSRQPGLRPRAVLRRTHSWGRSSMEF
ncbi:hypothetical protein Taro_018876 [Colocasia esculenta]|uniref:DUF4283 domain-containing protein n=1 Tax=Colocasia esculenta TaxID=4460 RepID=A0A843US71_COLES|nr:hypothetical protein [Colocasia esculenta]